VQRQPRARAARPPASPTGTPLPQRPTDGTAVERRPPGPRSVRLDTPARVREAAPAARGLGVDHERGMRVVVSGQRARDRPAAFRHRDPTQHRDIHRRRNPRQRILAAPLVPEPSPTALAATRQRAPASGCRPHQGERPRLELGRVLKARTNDTQQRINSDPGQLRDRDSSSPPTQLQHVSLTASHSAHSASVADRDLVSRPARSLRLDRDGDRSGRVSLRGMTRRADRLGGWTSQKAPAEAPSHRSRPAAAAIGAERQRQRRDRAVGQLGTSVEMSRVQSPPVRMP
jgi:hypothetical protein